MWAALLAGNLSTLLQALTGIDTGKQGRAHGDRLRHQLLRVPARVIRHARRLTLRLPPGHDLLPKVMAELRALPAPQRLNTQKPIPATRNRKPPTRGRHPGRPATPTPRNEGREAPATKRSSRAGRYSRIRVRFVSTSP